MSTGSVLSSAAGRPRPGTRAMAVAVLVAATAIGAAAQVTVQVDSTRNWMGYMNWYNTDGSYAGGSAWGLADLPAAFEPSLSNATTVVLGVNSGTYNPADPYWNAPDGTPNKLLEANFYVDVGTDYAGQDVTFVGTVEANTLPEGWSCEAVIKEFYSGYNFISDTRVPLVAGQPFSVSRAIGDGNICQYGFLTYGPNAEPGSPPTLTSVRIDVNNADPSITRGPADARKPVGETAVFTVAAVGESALSYQWYAVQGGLTNLLSDSATVSGSASDTLTLGNLQVSDSGVYGVTVTDLAGSKTAQATLVVKTPAEYVNFLENPGFEADPAGLDDAPWQRFETSAPSSGALQSTNETYLMGGNVSVHDGDWVSFTVFHGAYAGIYQDVPAEPGQIFTADAWFYNASGDPIPGGAGSGVTNECYLEVQFRAGETVLQQYTTDLFDYTLPRDQWIHLQATNAGGYGISPPASDARYLVTPPETTKVRFQITMHDIAGSAGLGSLYYDSARLLLKNPAWLDISEADGAVQVSWPTLAATEYQVQGKDGLDATEWTDAETVAGDGGTITRTYPAASPHRMYRVLTR